ncbi:hypothetical protein RRG08_063352 [Elysia crispata]|uniref:Uncharacterized protein n=1 Tax=Elysia crispata TaxID=231223 RepID=A0AAE1B289_9GAST|nr:hypothetical protein RRG08_063352 [Elysia crispata]
MSSAAVVCLIIGVCFSVLMTLSAGSSPQGVPQASECAPINLGYLVGDDHVTFSRGCYHSGPGHYVFSGSTLVNFRGEINWELWARDGSAKQIIVACAKIALQRGAPMFGVEYYGECYTGAEPDLSQGKVTPADGCSTLCPYDVGAANAVYVYDLFEWYKP